MAKLTDEEKQPLALDIFHKMDNEGVCYYFMEYGPDYGILKKLGLPIAKIKKAVEAAKYLNTVFDSIETMAEE